MPGPAGTRGARRTWRPTSWRSGTLENLFAPEGFPEREPWIAERLKGELTGWTRELFERKLDQLASVIARMNDGRGPDLLGVCEVENRFALESLAAVVNAALPERRYEIAHVDATRDQRGIDTAFLYDDQRLAIDPDAVFSHWVMRRTGTRDITQVTFRTATGREFIALANHWPSRSGGAYESRGYRMTAGETLAYWHERIWEEKGKDMPVIAMGDFNDDPFDQSLVIHARATRERDDLTRARTPYFFNLSWHYFAQEVVDSAGKPRRLHGTLYFQGAANVFDQILVGRALILDRAPIRVLEATTRMETVPDMVDRRASPGPLRFGLAKGNAAKNVDRNGFSDHYPVSVVLEER